MKTIEAGPRKRSSLEVRRKARRRTPAGLARDGFVEEARLHRIKLPSLQECIYNLLEAQSKKEIPVLKFAEIIALPKVAQQHRPLLVSVAKSGRQSFVSQYPTDLILRFAPPRIALETVLAGRRWRLEAAVRLGCISFSENDQRFDKVECTYCGERFSSTSHRRAHRRIPHSTVYSKYPNEIRLRFDDLASSAQWFREDICCPQKSPCTWSGSPAKWTPADNEESFLFGEIQRTSILYLRLRPIYDIADFAASFSKCFPQLRLISNINESE